MKNSDKIKFIMEATDCTRDEAECALRDNNWDIDEAIIDVRCDQIFS